MIHLCLAFDEQMALGAYAACSSAIAVTSQPLTIHFFTARPANNVSQCADLLRGKGATVVEHYLGDRADDLKCHEDFPTPVFYRLFIPDIIDAPRVIYLDSDMIVTKDLSDLAAMPLDGHPLAAAIDWAMFLNLDQKVPYACGNYTLSEYLRDIVGTDLAARRYFNSGLLLIDVEQWRERRLTQRIIDLVHAQKYPFRWSEQCALNAIIGQDYKILDPRWNSFVCWTLDRTEYDSKDNYWWQEVRTLWTEDPWILHFAGPYKPWKTEHERTKADYFFWNSVRDFPSAALRQLLAKLNRSHLDYDASLEEGITFNRSGKPFFAKHLSGFSQFEDWGRWTMGNEARIEFNEPLPKNFIIELVAKAFGPNADIDFVFQAGNSKSKLKVDKYEMRTYRVFVPNPERADLLTIAIPQPASPHSLGLSDDQRMLGLGLSSLKIKPGGKEQRLSLWWKRWLSALKRS